MIRDKHFDVVDFFRFVMRDIFQASEFKDRIAWGIFGVIILF